MSHYECKDCGVAAMDIAAEGVDPEFWFERDDNGSMLCHGCQAIRTADLRFAAGDW